MLVDFPTACIDSFSESVENPSLANQELGLKKMYFVVVDVLFFGGFQQTL